MSEPKYRDWILETIDSLRSRKARPDLERICRMVRRRHGSDPDRTRAELEKLIQEQTVLKVSYKGSISYRNAAKVQRKSRKKCEQTADSGSGSGESVGEQTKHASFNNNGDSAHSLTDQEEYEADGRTRSPESLSHTPASTPEKGEKVLPLISGNSSVSCGATGCTSGSGCGVKASAVKDKRLMPQAGGSASSPRHGTRTKEDGESDVSSQTKGAQGEETLGHEASDGNEKKTCTSASSGNSSHLDVRNKQQTPLKHKVKLGAKGESRSEAPDQCNADLGDRLVASVRSLTEKNRGSAAARGHAPLGLGLKEILGYLSTQGGLPEEKLTRNRVKLVLEREVGKGRLRRTRLGHITLPARGMGAAKPSARLVKSALQDRHLGKKGEKDEEQMETGSEGEEEEEKMEEEVDTQATLGSLTGLRGQSACPIAQSQLVGDTNSGDVTGMQKQQSSSPSLSTNPCAEMEAPFKTEGAVPQALVICLSAQRVSAAGSEVTRVEESTVTPDQLQPNAQDQLVVRSNDLPASLPVKNCCKVEVGVSSCLLTPTASPRDSGALEERGINGGVFVKSESTSVSPVEWTVADVVSYFTAAGFPEQATAFRTQEIDGKSLLLMQRNDVLTGLSIRLGPALKIYERHVKVLQRTHFQDDDGFC